MKFCSLVLELHLPQNFCHIHTDTQTHRQTDRHFPKIVKSCSGHPKTCKYIENRKLKICTKRILSSTYIEDSKKKMKWFFSCSFFMKLYQVSFAYLFKKVKQLKQHIFLIQRKLYHIIRIC